MFKNMIKKTLLAAGLSLVMLTPAFSVNASHVNSNSYNQRISQLLSTIKHDAAVIRDTREYENNYSATTHHHAKSNYKYNGVYSKYSLNHHSHRYNHKRILYIGRDYWVPYHNSDIRYYEKQMVNQSFKDINADRRVRHEPAYTYDKHLTKLANIRAGQIQKRFNHYDTHGHTYVNDDARRAGIPHSISNNMGENIADASLGNDQQTQDPDHYFNRNGKDLANEDDNAMMNYDAPSDNGHRDNILSDSGINKIGIASKYDPADMEFYLAEETE